LGLKGLVVVVVVVVVAILFVQVGTIIGKGGESIKSLQARSGARIQVHILRVILGCCSLKVCINKGIRSNKFFL
jgi:hypothetical protein